jgi:hypothetical protein
VDLGSYVLGSFVGMLPGTYAYVTAGHLGRAVLMEGGESALSIAPWQVAVGVGASLLAIGFIGQIAKRAIDEADAEAEARDGLHGQREEAVGERRQQAWGQAWQPQPQPQPAVD